MFKLNLGARLHLQPGEVRVVVHAFMLFFMIFSSYALLRPIRESMGLVVGVDHLQWLFVGTFVCTLLAQLPYAYVVSRVRKSLILPVIFGFFALNLLLFSLSEHLALWPLATAAAFYIWLSVFNLMVISLGWSLVNEVMNTDESLRLFGVAAAGSSAGSILGPLLTMLLVRELGHAALLLISAALLLCALYFSRSLRSWYEHKSASAAVRAQISKSIAGGVLDGVKETFKSPLLTGIALYIALACVLSTFLYFALMQEVRDTFEEQGDRTWFFASLDVAVNAVTIVLQLFVTGQVARRFGVSVLLLSAPLVVGLCCGLMLAWPGIVIVTLAMLSRRILEYAMVRPGKEMLYSVTSDSAKYKSKNFIDTVLYRLSDMLSGQLAHWCQASGSAVLAVAALVCAGIWGVNGGVLGWIFKRRSDRAESDSGRTKPDSI